MRPLEKVLDRVEGVEKRANGFWCLCPAHDDHNPSLHVEEAEDGRVLMVCRAGCTQAAVMAALEDRGLKPRDLFAGDVVPLAKPGRPRAAKSPAGPRGRPVRTFEVRGPGGALVAIHERYEAGPGEKSYAWRRRPGGPPGLEGLPLKELPLYGSELVADWPRESAVVLVEGEPAAEALRGAGIRALGTVCGAQSTPGPEALEVLAGCPVILWPDGDDQGQRHMRRVAVELAGTAAAVRWYEWPDPPEGVKGPDAADHPAVKSRDPEGLRDLRGELAAAPEWKPEPNPADVVDAPPGNPANGLGGSFATRDPAGFNLTDLGNSERFVADHGEDVRYCYPWGKWLVWTGARWERDEGGKTHRLAKETVRGIYAEAAHEPDDARRKELAKHATRSEAEAKIRAMLELAKSEVPVAPDELDADPWLLNVANGTVDLRFGALREHRREDLITKVAPVRYDPDASAPAWEAFLERVLPSEKLRGFVRRAAGYSATGDTSEQVMFINHGAGNNGKSTFQEALAGALGDYSMRAPTEMLMAKRSGGIPNDVARLKGARFVTASETEEGRRLAESLVKDLTGQDTISARFMRAEFFDFRPTHKLWLSTNHKPEIRGTDNAIWRRIRLVPWAVTVPPAERDRKLPDRLRRELPGILAWIVRGCLEWHRIGLRAPEEVLAATSSYRAEMDVLAAFVEDRCVVGPNAWAKFSDLWAAWQEWCEEAGEKPETKRRFGSRLKERGFEPGRGTDNIPIRPGIGLLEDHQTDPERGSRVIRGGENYSRVIPETPSKSTDSPEGNYRNYPETHINSEKIPSRGVNGKKGNYGNYGNYEETEEAVGEGLRELLADSPDWLRHQAGKHLEEPSVRTLNPLCVAVATHLYGDAGRWQEVKPAVERWLEEGPEGWDANGDGDFEDPQGTFEREDEDG